MHKWVILIFSRILCLGFGILIFHRNHTEEDVDYSKYLGPDWRKNKFKGKRVSTMISNHIGFAENPAWLAVKDTPPAFTPSSFVQ